MIQEVLNALAFLGERYVVGGAVRDDYLGLEPKDIDVATPLRPDEVSKRAQAAGYRVVPTGLKHGTVTLIGPGLPGPVEVTTYRQDVATDGRHATVRFSRSLYDDLSRRDFTLNAMAIGSDGKLIDPFGGRRDLAHGVLRSVGPAKERFAEDYLRVVRALRFAARYSLTFGSLWHDILSAVPQVAEHVAPERFVAELMKGLSGRGETAMAFSDTLFRSGLLFEFIPEFAEADRLSQNPTYHPEGSVWEHTLLVIAHAPERYRLHALLHDVGKMATAEAVVGTDYHWFPRHEMVGAGLIPVIAERLRLSRNVTDEIWATTRLHMLPLQLARSGTSVNVRRFQQRVGEHLVALEAVVRADRMGRPGLDESFLSELFTPVATPIVPILLGRHLIDRGHRPGPEFGPLLERAFNYQLEHGEENLERLYAAAVAEV